MKIVIADRQKIFRQGLRLELEYSLKAQVSEASSCVELLEIVEKEQPDLILISLLRSQFKCLDVIKSIAGSYFSIIIVILSTEEDPQFVKKAIAAGAAGHISRNDDSAAIIESICYYMNNNGFKNAITGTSIRTKKRISFTKKEKTIMCCICKEMSNKEISDLLFLSVRTIEGYRCRIQQKIGAKTIVGIALYSIEHGLFEF